MEQIEAELNNKAIERVKEVVVEKPKKERTQAQKEAFEKARLKRAENIAKKKAEAQVNLNAEDEYNDAEVEEQPTEVQAPPQPQPEPKPAPKRRGRPRKKKEEPPAPHFIPPTTGIPQNLYSVQGHNNNYPMMMPNGFPYWMYQPPPQKEAVVNNYYYGTNPKEIRSEHKETIREPVKPPTPPAPVESSSEEEEEYELPQDPRLKYRFA